MPGLIRNFRCMFRPLMGVPVREFALSLALFAGAGLAIGSLRDFRGLDVGGHTMRVLTLGLPVPDSRPKEPALLYRAAGLRTE